MAFWSDNSSIKFFNISTVDLNTALSSPTEQAIDDANNDIINQDDLLIDESKQQSESIFTINENEDDMNNHLDSEDIADQTLRVDSYLSNDQATGNEDIPIIRTINISDELNNINKQLVFISDVIAWLKLQIIRIKPILHSSDKLRLSDQDTFNAIIVCLRKLLMDSAAITSLCVSSSTDDNESASLPKNDDNDDKKDKSNTSSYLRMIVDIVRDLTDECCKGKKIECINLFKQMIVDVATNKLTHHLVVQLLTIFIDRINNYMLKLDIKNDNTMKQKKQQEKDSYSSPKYVFHFRILNCDYFVNHKLYKSDSKTAYSAYLKQAIAHIITILKKRKFRILYVLSASAYNVENMTVPETPINITTQCDIDTSDSHSDPIPRIQGATLPLNVNKIELKDNKHSIVTNPNPNSQDIIAANSPSSTMSNDASDPGDDHEMPNHMRMIVKPDNKYSKIMIAVDIQDVVPMNLLSLDCVVSIVSDEIIQTVADGDYRLNIRFYPMYDACKHRVETDFFYHRGLSLRDGINQIIQKKQKKYNLLMKSVLCLSLQKQPTDKVIFERFRLLKVLKDILIRVHGDDAKYEIFGSIATKLDHIDSDLDISIHLPPSHKLSFDAYFKNVNIADLSMEAHQLRIQTILKPVFRQIDKVQQSPEFKFKVVFLEHATVPIVKITNEINGMQSDISVCLKESVIKTALIKKYVSIDWRVKPLVLAIKHWVKSRKLNNTHRGDLNSFGVTLMIIHYLQTLSPPILPILEINQGKMKNVKGWMPDWIAAEKFVEFGRSNQQNIGQLFGSFFIYFDQIFKPEVHAICITKNDKNSDGFLDKKFCKLQNNHNDVLIVLDPLDESDNIGRRVTEVTWNNMQKEFKLAAQMIA